jgi:hypothetical protein
VKWKEKIADFFLPLHHHRVKRDLSALTGGRSLSSVE